MRAARRLPLLRGIQTVSNGGSIRCYLRSRLPFEHCFRSGSSLRTAGLSKSRVKSGMARDFTDSRQNASKRAAMDYFSANLKLLCGTQRSVSALCHQWGNGSIKQYYCRRDVPSAHNLRRYLFRVPSDDLFLPSVEFNVRYEGFLRPKQLKISHHEAAVCHAFPGHLRRLRPLLGFYHSHFCPCPLPILLRGGWFPLSKRMGRLSKDIERNGAHANPQYRQNYI